MGEFPRGTSQRRDSSSDQRHWTANRRLIRWVVGLLLLFHGLIHLLGPVEIWTIADPAVVAIHAATNTTVGLLPVLPHAVGSQIPLWTAISIAAVVALLLVVRTKGRLGHGGDVAGSGHLIQRP